MCLNSNVLPCILKVVVDREFWPGEVCSEGQDDALWAMSNEQCKIERHIVWSSKFVLLPLVNNIGMNAFNSSYLVVCARVNKG